MGHVTIGSARLSTKQIVLIGAIVVCVGVAAWRVTGMLSAGSMSPEDKAAAARQAELDAEYRKTAPKEEPPPPPVVNPTRNPRGPGG